MFLQIINWKVCRISLLRKLLSKKFVSECIMSVTWNFPHDSQNKHTCKKLLFSNDYDVQLLINTLILVLFLIGTQNCFFVTRSDKTKKNFSLFQYWSCYTTNVLWQQRRKKHCNCINFVHTNNVYFWKLYSFKIHLLHPFVYQYLSLPITIECYWGQKEKIWMNKRNF